MLLFIIVMTVVSNTTVTKLGAIFDHIYLCNIAKIRNILSQNSCRKISPCLLHSGWIELLSGCPNKSNTLQLVQHAAAPLLTRTNIRDCISLILASLVGCLSNSEQNLKYFRLTKPFMARLYHVLKSSL